MVEPSERSRGALPSPAEDSRTLLRSLELLDGLSDEALAAVEDEVRWIEMPAGSRVFQQGDPSDSVYFVATGRLGVVQRDEAGDERAVREVGAGQPIGELGLLLDRPRSATAIALRDSVLVRLDREGFERLVEREPTALLSLSRRIAERLVNPPGRETRALATLVVGNSPSVRRADVWRRLSELLTANGARCMSTADLARACGGSGRIQPARAARWLETQLRAGHPIFVLGEGEDDITALLATVDRTLIIADAEKPSRIGPLGAQLERLRELGIRPFVDLMLLQRRDRLPDGTAAWLEQLHPTRHHHLRLGDRSGLERLARRLTGRAIALALGGGGARGFAHIGVIRALRESGVPIDVVAGTNTGAVVGAQLALGWEPERMLEVNAREWPRVGREFALPLVALLGGARLRDLARRMFADVAIEDLWLDFRCASVDLSWCRLEAHRRGPLKRWVRASASVPGIHPPVVHAGRLYVDGGLLCHVPTELAHEAGVGQVISVDPSPLRRHTLDERVQEAPAGLDFLLQRLPVVGSGFPSIVWLIHRAFSLVQQLHQRECRASSALYIEPPVDRFGATDYARVADIAEVGYEETLRLLEQDGGLALA